MGLQWGTRHRPLLVRMCLKVLSCFQASSVSNALRGYFWSLDAVKNHDVEPVQVCRAWRKPDQVLSSHVTVVLVTTEKLFSRFLFSPRTERLNYADPLLIPVLLHLCTGLGTAALVQPWESSNSDSCFSCQWNKNGKQQRIKSHCLILNYRGHCTLLSCLSVLWACVSTPVQGNAIGKGDAIRNWFIKVL